MHCKRHQGSETANPHRGRHGSLTEGNLLWAGTGPGVSLEGRKCGCSPDGRSGSRSFFLAVYLLAERPIFSEYVTINLLSVERQKSRARKASALGSASSRQRQMPSGC